MLITRQDPDELHFQYRIIPNGTEVLIAKVNSKPPSTSGRQPYEFVKISPRYLKDEYPAPSLEKILQFELQDQSSSISSSRAA